MAKKKRKRKSDLAIYETPHGGYGIYWKDTDYPNVRLTVREDDDTLYLQVHVDGISDSRKPALSVIPEVSNSIRIAIT